MKTRFSKTTGTFYPLDIDYPNLPADVQEVDLADYEKAMARPSGYTFDFIDGVLVISAPVPTPYADIRDAYLTGTVRPLREQILNRLAGIGFAAANAATPDTALVQEVVTSRQALLDITKDAGVLAATNLDDLKAAVLTAYRRITSGASVDIVNAFKGVDQ